MGFGTGRQFAFCAGRITAVLFYAETGAAILESGEAAANFRNDLCGGGSNGLERGGFDANL